MVYTVFTSNPGTGSDHSEKRDPDPDPKYPVSLVLALSPPGAGPRYEPDERGCGSGWSKPGSTPRVKAESGSHRRQKNLGPIL